ncbi:hypothetical protein [Intestinibacter bartlettii]|nr:hypothetical protein [Intestinibacter bartlettii]
MDNKKIEEENIKKEILNKLKYIHDIKYLKLIKIFIYNYNK